MNLGKLLQDEGQLGVQVVEGVGLVASCFQFLLGLAPVFAEEVGGFGVIGLISCIKCR